MNDSEARTGDDCVGKKQEVLPVKEINKMQLVANDLGAYLLRSVGLAIMHHGPYSDSGKGSLIFSAGRLRRICRDLPILCFESTVMTCS